MTDPGRHPTFDAEECADVDQLERYAADPSSITREGAVYGMQALRDRLTRALQRMAKDDPSPGVRTAATEALE